MGDRKIVLAVGLELFASVAFAQGGAPTPCAEPDESEDAKTLLRSS